jgi:anti-sigma factor RsiW
MTLQCQEALPLVPAYLDGELSEAQASLLRKHLLSCFPCRSSAQDGKTLKRWFVSAQSAAVPSGFAARVARRAMAGDLGQSGPLPAALAFPAGARAEDPERGKLLDFVLRATAIAATIMLVLAIGLRSQELPRGSELKADDRLRKSWEEVSSELDALNATQPASKPISAKAAGSAQPRPIAPMTSGAPGTRLPGQR